MQSWDCQERRKFVRAKYPCKIIVYTQGGRSISGYTENIGAGGVRILIEEQLGTASLVGLEIQLEEKVVSCDGRVVWVIDKVRRSPQEEPRCDIGIEYARMKEEDRVFMSNFVTEIFLRNKEPRSEKIEDRQQ